MMSLEDYFLHVLPGYGSSCVSCNKSKGRVDGFFQKVPGREWQKPAIHGLALLGYMRSSVKEATVSPMANELVAAGEGALHT